MQVEIIIALGINILTAFLKQYIYPKFGSIGVQVAVFALALVGAVGYGFYQQSLMFQQVIIQALGTLAIAISVYEVILKRLPFFGEKN